MNKDVPKEIKASTEVTPKDTPKKKKEITMSGKGDKPRPYSTSQEEYARKWDKAFGKEATEKDNADKILQEVAECAAESVTIPEEKDIKEITQKEFEIISKQNRDKQHKANGFSLLNDKSLEYQLERMKTGHA